MWQYQGQKRPSFAEEPGPGQESVWDYPRPPAIVVDQRRIEVSLGNLIIADSQQNYRILETASPPTFYIPPHNVRIRVMEPFRGVQSVSGRCRPVLGVERPAGFSAVDRLVLSDSKSPFEAIAGYFSFYPSLVECFVDGERVQPQPGEFYGGWVTGEIVGPYKGEPGTGHW